jgi:alpha-amylase
MANICLYFQVHQPRRLRRFQAFDIGQDVDYFADYEDGSSVNNPEVLKKLTRKSYAPANSLMLELLQNYPEMRVTYSFSGSVLEQLEENVPEVLAAFQAIVRTGQVDILGETYYHSLAGAFHVAEFREQVHLHQEKIRSLFGIEPVIFCNTQLEFNTEIAQTVTDMGFKAMLIEGNQDLLGNNSANHLYRLAEPVSIPLLIKNSQLSDDIAVRFSNSDWDNFPLTADKFTSWLDLMQDEAEVVNLVIDYDTFGHRHSKESGIFEFMHSLPASLLSRPANKLNSPSVIVEHLPVHELAHANQPGGWHERQGKLTDWLDNDMQKDSAAKIYALRDRVLATGKQDLIETWRHLQTADHLGFMSTQAKKSDHSQTFNPYESPYTAFLSYMNILQDFELQLSEAELAANAN